MFGGGYVGPDGGYGDVWDNHASIVHDRDLEVSSSNLPLYKDHFDISYVVCIMCGGGEKSPPM